MSESVSAPQSYLDRFISQGQVEIGVSYVKAVATLIFCLALGAFILWIYLPQMRDAAAGAEMADWERIAVFVIGIGIPGFMLVGAIVLIIQMINRTGLVLTHEGFRIGPKPIIAWTWVRGYSVVRFRGGGDTVTVRLDPTQGRGRKVTLSETIQIPSRELAPLMQACQRHALRQGR